MKNINSIQSFLIIISSEPHLGSHFRLSNSISLNSNYQHILLDDLGIDIVLFSRFKDEYLKNSNEINLLLGDNLEWDETVGEECMAYASFIKINSRSRSLKIMTSIVGLPPVFIYKDKGMIVLTSDLYLLTMVGDLCLSLNPESVVDFCKIGHPINYMTLFENVTMVPCGSLLEWNAGGSIKVKNVWQFQASKDILDMNTYCESQIEAFSCAMDKLDLKDTFLSLTAGLDTRTILSELIYKKRPISAAYTISGKNRTLDARVANRLCKEYNIEHNIIIIDDTFFMNLDKYINMASFLSGGIHSLDQATEIYFYENIDRKYKARVSGNLGNQIGRKGTEGVSLRNANIKMLHPDFISKVKNKESVGHWFNSMKQGSGGLEYNSLLQYEVPHSSVGNYCIGNFYALQKSPYAYKKLFETSQNNPLEGENDKKQLSVLAMRLKDLKHRFMGDSEKRSFQRMLIKKHGGFLAHYPINWGWRASGGISYYGLIQGTLALADVIAEKKAEPNGFIDKIMYLTGITGLHEYRHPKHWLRQYLKEYIYDNILSCKLQEILNKNYLYNILNEYFNNNNNTHYATIVSALDLSIAIQHYIR